MVDLESFKQLALSFPETAELPHFELTSFRVHKKIFATLDLRWNRACLMLSEIDQSVFCLHDKTAIYPVPDKWGQKGATYFELGLVPKKILKDAFADYLPEEIYNRKKQGFEVPLLKWFRTELKGMITDDLLNEQFIKEQSIFNYSEVKIILDRLFSTDPGDSVARIWGLVVFQYWWKKNMNA